MAQNFIYDPENKKKSFSRMYGVLFCIFVVALGTLIFSLIRTDLITNTVLRKKNIPFLLILADDDGPLLSQAVLFHAKTRRLALIDVPPEAGDLLPQLQRSDRYSVFYRQKDKKAYRESIEELLKIRFLFVLDLHIDKLVPLVDLLEGIDLYFFAPVDQIDVKTKKRYIYNAGRQELDGDQARNFLYLGRNLLPYNEYLADQQPADDLSLDNEAALRQKNLRFARELLLGIASVLQRYGDERERYIDWFYRYFDTDLNKRAFRRFLRYLSEMDVQAAEVIFQDYLGKLRQVRGKRIHFPIYDGEVIRSQVVRISAQLQTQDEIMAQEYPVRLEVLNGTNIAGLASRTAAIYTNQGFDVLKVDNAERADYEKTLIVNLHSSSEDDVRRAAAVIGAENLILQPLPGGEQAEAEVRVILGRDFDGNRVAQ